MNYFNTYRKKYFRYFSAFENTKSFNFCPEIEIFLNENFRLSERTFSLWGYMANHMNEYMNPLYCAEETPGTIVPNLFPQNIRFWRGMYCRFESGVHPREPLGDLLLATCDHSYSLEDHIRYLTKVSVVLSVLFRRIIVM